MASVVVAVIVAVAVAEVAVEVAFVVVGVVVVAAAVVAVVVVVVARFALAIDSGGCLLNWGPFGQYHCHHSKSQAQRHLP